MLCKIIVTRSTQPKHRVQPDLSDARISLLLPTHFNVLFLSVSQRPGEQGLVVPTVRQPPQPYGDVMQTGTQFVMPVDSTINCTMWVFTHLMCCCLPSRDWCLNCMVYTRLLLVSGFALFFLFLPPSLRFPWEVTAVLCQHSDAKFSDITMY